MAGYIVLPIPRDVASAEEASLDVARAQWGDTFQPEDADPFSVLMRAGAQLYADVAYLITRQAEESFRFYGRTVAGVNPIDDKPATVEVEFTARDANGPYEVPEGTQVSGTGPGGQPVGFATITDLTIESGQTTGTVTAEALVDGTEGNGISGTGTLEEFFDYLDETVTFVNPSTGGQDAEDDRVYLDRLAIIEQLAEPKPVMLPEFARMARVLGAHRATAIHGLNPAAAVNEVQTLVVPGTATAGTATPSFNGQAAGAIPFNGTASQVKTALEAAANIFPGDVEVTGGPLGTATVYVTFTGQYRWTNVPQMTIADSITGGDMTVSTQTAGVAPLTAEPLTVAVAMIDESGEPDADAGDIAATMQAMREQNFRVYELTPSYTSIDATVTGTALPGWDASAVQTAVEEAAERRLSPAYHGIPLDTGEVREWLNRPTLAHSSVMDAVQDVEGLDTTLPVTLTIGRTGGALGTADVVLAGYAPLPRPGTITATISPSS